METNEKMIALQMYESRKLQSGTAWLLFLLLGWSYGSMNAMGKQILFYITLGGLGIWTLVRLFTLGGAIKDYNKQIAISAGLGADDLMRLGLV